MEIRDYEHPSSYADRQGAIRYLRAFRRHWLLIVVLVVVTVGVTAALTLTAPKKYQATADLQINPISGNSTSQPQGFGSLFYQPSDGSSVVVTAARFMNSSNARDAALAKLGIRNGISFSVTPLSQADIVAVTATARSPRVAASAANAYVDTFVASRTAQFHHQLLSRIAFLNRRISAIPLNQRVGNAELGALQAEVANLREFLNGTNPSLVKLPPATPPSSPSSPRPRLSIAIAVIAGLLLGCGAAVALEFFNPRLTDEEELRLGQRLPVLARIPRLRERVARRYLTGRGLLPSEAWKGYRTLRTVLATVGEGGGYPRSILVTSASPREGKTMTAVNLAITLATADLNVILVDADFHRPMIGSIFNVGARPYSLTRLLVGGLRSSDELLVPAPNHPRLRLLVSSREHSTHLHLLDTERFRSILAHLEKEADVVVVDSPPLPEVAETLAMANAAEAVLITVRLGHTRRDKLEQLRELLARRGIAPLGFVVVPRSRSDGGDSYYGYASDIPASPASEPARVADVPQPKVVRAIDQ